MRIALYGFLQFQPMSPLAKLLWLKNKHPERFQAVRYFMDIKTYVFNRLFGVYKLDLSLASATGLYHLENQQWDYEILDMLGITRDKLPEIVSPYEIESGLSSQEKSGTYFKVSLLSVSKLERRGRRIFCCAN